MEDSNNNSREDHKDEDEEFFKQTSPVSLLNYMKLYGSFDKLRGALAKELEDSVCEASSFPPPHAMRRGGDLRELSSKIPQFN